MYFSLFLPSDILECQDCKINSFSCSFHEKAEMELSCWAWDENSCIPLPKGYLFISGICRKTEFFHMIKFKSIQHVKGDEIMHWIRLGWVRLG